MMEEKIRRVLTEKVGPLLDAHHGGVDLMRYENGVAYVKMTGACGSCPSAQYTVEEVIRSIMLEELPALENVILDTSVSSDLIDMAKKILNGELR
ncbi:MAG: NifU family protein [Clostridiales Family XIII bacterium]|jgi:Fe-S cluster biogenesis protein NfuA|nr:NifU family protein [Clostridiales Family XIII bacterium]